MPESGQRIRREDNRTTRMVFRATRTTGLPTRQLNRLRHLAANEARAPAGLAAADAPCAVERRLLATTVGARLRHLRQAADLTQRQLAEHAGCSRHTVGRLERGRLRPEPASLRRLLVPLTRNGKECEKAWLELRALATAARQIANRTPP
ncbi:Helix-turn-helix domain-containing protein [Amycolatopsis arida]|uniref:Helix-turn-helix domain-containing protein n=1 Tax=Amycolatopsis arida TaxID=587909 RepID=A0A1I5R0Z9_9PSEU|nr:helix-turn-helix transcriptional regulator [Amycolatopsis arida]TDX99034.1 helix-turn-helix protein [Amycolatopsis arida]SFP52172.1 Helix-turn-helix domain-containing protein [Amycolatopsis arida]